MTVTAIPVRHDAAALRRRRTGSVYLVCGGIGLIAAAVLTLEKLAKLADPAYIPSCSINPVLSCGSIMDSAQSAVFGFPNPLIGLVAFPIVLTAGVALRAGFVPPRWFTVGMQLGTLLGAAFVHWLIWASLAEIGALCPYCMVVWIATMTLLWRSVAETLQLYPRTRPLAGRVLALHTAGPVLWCAVVLALILWRFRDFWFG